MSGGEQHIPLNDEAEEAVLGAALIGAKIPDFLEPEHFYREQHRIIFRAIRELDAADVVTITAALERRGELETAGGKALIYSLGSSVPQAAHAEHYAGIVLQQAAQREFDAVAHDMAGSTEPLNGNVTSYIDRLRAVEGIIGNDRGRGLEVLTAREFYALPEPDGGAELLGRLVMRGNRVLIGGDTGHGKTTLGLQAVAAIIQGEEFLDWTGAGGRALIIDAEQGLRTGKRRLREAGLDTHDDVDYLHVPDGLALDSASGDIAAVERVLAQGHYDVVLIDPLYKIHEGDSNAERDAVTLMKRLDYWRETYGFALIIDTHVRKPPIGAKFSLHEFFGSSAYTRGAEVVLGIRRLRPGYSQLHFLKDRDGDLPVGEVWGLLFDREAGYRRDPDDEKPSATERIRELLEAEPGLTIEDLAASADCSEKTVRTAFKALDAEGTETKPKRWSLPAKGAQS